MEQVLPLHPSCLLCGAEAMPEVALNQPNLKVHNVFNLERHVRKAFVLPIFVTIKYKNVLC